MNYQAVFDYANDISQNLGLTVKFFHGRKEWLNLTISDKPLYIFMLPLVSAITFNTDNIPQQVWSMNLLFYQQDKSDSAIDQNNEDVQQDEMKILAVTSGAVDKFLRLFSDNQLTTELEESSEFLTITSATTGNVIKDTANLLTGTILTINFLVADDFDYCC